MRRGVKSLSELMACSGDSFSRLVRRRTCEASSGSWMVAPAASSRAEGTSSRSMWTAAAASAVRSVSGAMSSSVMSAHLAKSAPVVLAPVARRDVLLCARDRLGGDRGAQDAGCELGLLDETRDDHAAPKRCPTQQQVAGPVEDRRHASRGKDEHRDEATAGGEHRDGG